VRKAVGLPAWSASSYVGGRQEGSGCGRRKCKVERVLDVVGARELV
jgi:hypothetical protein